MLHWGDATLTYISDQHFLLVIHVLHNETSLVDEVVLARVLLSQELLCHLGEDQHRLPLIVSDGLSCSLGHTWGANPSVWEKHVGKECGVSEENIWLRRCGKENGMATPGEEEG